MPTYPDQTRYSGPDEALVDANMGAYYLTQGSNKRSLTLDLKTEKGRAILKKLVAGATSFWRTIAPARWMRWASAYAIWPRSIRS